MPAINIGGFPDALHAIKNGHSVRRAGWNGKGMALFLINGTRCAYKGGLQDEPVEVLLTPFIALKTVDNKLVPWVASQTDLLAEDWELVP